MACKSYDGENLIVNTSTPTSVVASSSLCWGRPAQGKTTCLMMLAGFETPPPAKSVWMASLTACRHCSSVQYRHGVPELCLVPTHDGRRKPGLPLKIRSCPPPVDAKRSSARWAWSKLDKFANRYPGQMSGGQQRVALARGRWCSSRSWC